jgi:glutamate synthase domain-containing protein 3
MRGGKIFIKGNVGYRVGIHMKAYKNLYPVVIAGGSAGDFLGEYMAGGMIIVFGSVGNYIGTGMHGGAIYIQDKVEKYQLGEEVEATQLDGNGFGEIEEYLREYCRDLNLDFEEIKKKRFVRLTPLSTRPYDRLYAY